jgi:hypothetical protein
MKNILIKKVIASSTISLVMLPVFYSLIIEPRIALATVVTNNVIVTLNVTSGVTISTGSNVTMLPNIGIASDRAVGASAWTVATNSATGYTLAVKASTNPALKNGVIDSFANYTETVVGTPELWTGVTAGLKEFGYGAYGTDTPTATWGTPTGCGNTGTGAPDAAGKFKGMTTTDATIASRSTVTPTAGITTNICFAAQENAVYAAAGAYTATITATATAV